MPDWSYHIIFKPMLTKLSPYTSREFIHRGMNAIASLPVGSHIINFLGREECSPLLEKQLDGVKYNNPVGLSGKIDPLLSGTKAFSHLGFGFIEIGPITMKPSLNAQLPIINREDKQIHFPCKHESIGLETTIDKLTTIKKKQPLFMRISGSKAEIFTMIQELDSYADGYIIESYDPSYVTLTSKPIYVVVPSNEKTETLVNLFHTFSGVIIDGDSFIEILNSVQRLKKIDSSKTILTSGGIHEPDQALQLLNAGADLVMLVDGYVFSGPGLTKRINEALLNRVEQPSLPQKGWKSYWIFGLLIFLGGLLALLFSLTTIILPYDELFLNTKKENLWNFNDRIMLFMAHDRMTLAGTMISGGIVYMNLAKNGIRRKLKWSKQVTDIAAIIGFLGIFLFIGYGYFDWLHLVFWITLLPFYIYGFYQTRNVQGTPTSTNLKNHRAWQMSLLGQFLFVLLGFSFVFGGIIISIYGVTSVFVPTDLLYICMSIDQLQSFNENLLSLIAHDRAGFGSALLSVGLLVLMIALWGYQQGNKWVWWTFFIGGLPAFITAIYVHFAIGYTTFIHLLPAYFAFIVYICGLIVSYSYLSKINPE
ncbi:dihydroorotate dehydrogenase [Bacillus solimangrovi]|uniref:Dihydroorotate dehydrogenase n=1 Tax=Bacillus solimangrovi TaxID=1305675 RepID=A0A1E5LJZ5_9BACI|nr:dihydroorotate dehydrogenase [Bacillus solimangrovi]OEH94410.1 dihydroorotate dehydrogenase [Bacillus solimangrovi]